MFDWDCEPCRFVPLDNDGRGRVQQYLRHALDRFLHAKRLAVVSAARDLLMAPDSETVDVGLPLPVNPEAASHHQRLASADAGFFTTAHPLLR